MRFYLITVLFLVLSLVPVSVHAQQPAAPCGVVDAIDYPIDGLVAGYDDFGKYRQRFGGDHTGLDLGFDRWGDAVRAVARGRVTYADPEGWGTERGVVVIEHRFPDGSTAYSVYGHMEQSAGINFPEVGACIERGNLIGTIGWPSKGRPHLHYEIRAILPAEGGPGYVVGNPLEQGWYNPLDFTALWRARLGPGFLDYLTFDVPATLPPVQLDSGMDVIASGNILSAVQPPNQALWHVQTDGDVTGLVALPDNRVVAHSRNGQVVVLRNGRFITLWTVNGPDVPFVLLGDQLIFATSDGGLAAYDFSGSALWAVSGTAGASTLYFGLNGQHIALCIQTGTGVIWRAVDGKGQVTAEIPLTVAPVVSPMADGSWIILQGNALVRIQNNAVQPIVVLAAIPGQKAQLTSDAAGNSYIYVADAANTLLALDAAGKTRWQITYPGDANPDAPPPLLQAGNGCWLYTLDADGKLNIFKASDGTQLRQIQLYAGDPRGRWLHLGADRRLQVASGFLTTLTFDDARMGGETGCS